MPDLELVFNEEEGTWEERAKPYIIVEIETEEDYALLQKAIDHYHKHGRWVDRYGMKYANHLYECSVCKNPALYMPITDSLGSDHIYQATTLFCPYCGARMDLEE